MLIGFALIAWLANQHWFYQAFGFPPGQIAPALLLFSLLSGTVGFWVTPLANWWSRKNEYEADAFAAQATGSPQSLVTALHKLNEKNSSNLTPHPIYSTVYYSHPALVEREAALTGSA
jgi:STE24 endopeptidase